MAASWRCARSGPALLALVILATGCAWTARIPPPPIAQPLVAPLPLAVGIYFDDELRQREINEQVLTDTFRTPIGAASVQWLEHAFAGTFAHVVPLAAPPTGMPDPGLDAVIEVRLAKLSHRFAEKVFLEFEVRLLDRDGAEIVRWPVTGTYQLDEAMKAVSFGQRVRWSGKGLFAVEEFWGAQVAEAIRQAAKTFLLHFREQPDVRRWLDARKAFLPPVPEAGESLTREEDVSAARRVLVLGEPHQFVACLTDELTRAQFRVVAGAEVRDTFYPWLEPPLVASHFQRLARLPLGATRLQEAGLRDVIVLSGLTQRSDGGGLLCGGGFGAGGCFGILWKTRKTFVTAGVVDLYRDVLATHEVRETGGLVVPAFILPVPIWWSTEADACADLGKAILPSLEPAR